MATSVISSSTVFMRRTANTYSRTGYHWENGRTGGETEVPPASPRQDRLLWRDKRSSHVLTPLPCPGPLPHCIREVCPEPLVPPVGKENLGRHPTSPSVVGGFVGALILISRSGDHREICGLNPWESDCDREEGKHLQHLALES